MGAEIRAVLCDLDGVLRRWDPAVVAAAERAHGVPAGSVARAAFAPERLGPAVTGAVTDEQWRAAVARDLVPVCGTPERAAALVARWSAGIGEVDHAVLALLTAVRGRRLPVVLVTNATTRLDTDLAALGLVGRVDAVVNSCRVGAAKPDPLVYAVAARAAGVAPAHCLFVDDAAENVAAARRCGMAAHHYRDPAGLREALSGLLPEVPPPGIPSPGMPLPGGAGARSDSR